MEDYVFYLVFWLFWVCLTFMVKKQNPFRLQLSAIILITIIFSNSYIFVGHYKIVLSGLFLLVTVYWLVRKEKLRSIIYLSVCSLILSISYITFQLFEIFDPIWIMFKRDWMLAIVIGYLSMLLQKTLRGRLVIVVSGTMQGDILYAYIVKRLDFPYEIGSMDYLNVLSLTALLLSGWSLLEHTGAVLQNAFHLQEKTKQKSS
ncbi:YphA family membrane protein [Neobacillus sp. Marseille-QA0830]